MFDANSKSISTSFLGSFDLSLYLIQVHRIDCPNALNVLI